MLRPPGPAGDRARRRRASGRPGGVVDERQQVGDRRVGAEAPGLQDHLGARPDFGRPGSARPFRRAPRRRRSAAGRPPIWASAVTASMAVPASSAGRPVRRSMSGCDGRGVPQQAEGEGRDDSARWSPDRPAGAPAEGWPGDRRSVPRSSPPCAGPASRAPPSPRLKSRGSKSRASSAARSGAICSTTASLLGLGARRERQETPTRPSARRPAIARVGSVPRNEVPVIRFPSECCR